MDLTRQAILNTKTIIPGILGYLTLVLKVENNVSVNPDIAIESCKSLIEGLCLKTLTLLSDKYNGSKRIQSNCKNDLKKLTNMAFDEVYSNFVERQLHESLSTMIIDVSVSNRIKDKAKRKVKEQTKSAVAKISALRNERGDISHGRNYPKDQESSTILAKSIQSITDGICSFMILEIGTQYKAKNKEGKKLIYKELKDFNTWLDEIHNISTIKVDYSKLLYENAPDKYEEFYYAEYLEAVEIDLDSIKEEIDKASEEIDEVVAPVVLVEVQNPTFEYLVNKFNQDLFWTEKRNLKLLIFIADEKLKLDPFKELINNILFTEKAPLRDDIRSVMIELPALLKSKKVLLELTERILNLVEELKVETE